jgi:hypothetical protein
MEPWSENSRREEYRNKPLSQKILGAVIVIYAGFAICIAGTLAECVTIPLAAKLKRRRLRRNESR